jgi:cell division protease FtsH
LSEKLGPLTYTEDDGEVFLGHSVTKHKQVSDDTAHVIDQEIRDVIDRNYRRARSILQENMAKLQMMADALMKYETLDTDQIDDIMAGNEPRPPHGWSDDDRHPPKKTVAGEAAGEPTPKDTAIGGPASSHQRRVSEDHRL